MSSALYWARGTATTPAQQTQNKPIGCVIPNEMNTQVVLCKQILRVYDLFANAV